MQEKSCFEIAHDRNYAGWWITKETYEQLTLRRDKVIQKQTYRVKTMHQLYINLKESYGITPTVGKKKQRSSSDDEEEFDDGLLGDDDEEKSRETRLRVET